MKRFMRVVVTLMFCGSIAEARIGETIEQLKQRYGQPVKSEVNTNYKDAYILTFQKAPFLITIYTRDGKAGWMYYEKETEITEDQVKEILSRNFPNTTMEDKGTKNGIHTWESKALDLAELDIEAYSGFSSHPGWWRLGLLDGKLEREKLVEDEKKAEQDKNQKKDEVNGF